MINWKYSNAYNKRVIWLRESPNENGLVVPIVNVHPAATFHSKLHRATYITFKIIISFIYFFRIVLVSRFLLGNIFFFIYFKNYNEKIMNEFFKRIIKLCAIPEQLCSLVLVKYYFFSIFHTFVLTFRWEFRFYVVFRLIFF